MVVPHPSVPPGATETAMLSRLNDFEVRFRLLEDRVNHLEAENIRLRAVKGESNDISVNTGYSFNARKTENELFTSFVNERSRESTNVNSRHVAPWNELLYDCVIRLGLSELGVFYDCRLCIKSFCSKESVLEHIASEQHGKAMKEKGEDLQLLIEFIKDEIITDEAENRRFKGCMIKLHGRYYDCRLCGKCLGDRSVAVRHIESDEHASVARARLGRPTESCEPFKYTGSFAERPSTPQIIEKPQKPRKKKKPIVSGFVANAHNLFQVGGKSILRCTVCNVNLNGKQEIDEHLHSSEHSEKVKRLNDGDMASEITRTVNGLYRCSVCNCMVPGNDDARVFHALGKKHIKKYGQSGRDTTRLRQLRPDLNI